MIEALCVQFELHHRLRWQRLDVPPGTPSYYCCVPR